MKGICILGATGSIGVSTLDVVARHSNLYNVVALTANKNIDALYEQCLAHSPEVVVIVDEQKAAEFKTKIEHSTLADLRILSGADALIEVATLPNVDSVMAAIVGAVVSKPMPIILTSFCGLDWANLMHSSADETTRTSAPAARLFWRLSLFVPGTRSMSPKVANIVLGNPDK